MNSDGVQIVRRWIFVAIGAGTIVLALIAFSGICWGTLAMTGADWIRGWGFWEVCAIVGVAGGFVLFLRPVRTRLVSRAVNAARVAPALSGFVAPTEGFNHRHDVAAPPTQTAAHSVVDSIDDCSEAERTLREMYAQLSDEERRELKALMRRYCSGENPDAPSEAS